MKREKQLVRFSHLMAGEVVADGTATAERGIVLATTGFRFATKRVTRGILLRCAPCRRTPMG